MEWIAVRNFLEFWSWWWTILAHFRVVQKFVAERERQKNLACSHSQQFSLRSSAYSQLLFIIVLGPCAGGSEEACASRPTVRMWSGFECRLWRLVGWEDQDVESIDMEENGLVANMGKTKVMRCRDSESQIVKSGKYPCSKDVGSNSIQCTSCHAWIHKKCSGITGKLNMWRTTSVEGVGKEILWDLMFFFQ